MEEVPNEDRVWVEHRGRWHPGILETWIRKDGVLRCEGRWRVVV